MEQLIAAGDAAEPVPPETIASVRTSAAPTLFALWLASQQAPQAAGATQPLLPPAVAPAPAPVPSASAGLSAPWAFAAGGGGGAPRALPSGCSDHEADTTGWHDGAASYGGASSYGGGGFASGGADPEAAARWLAEEEDDAAVGRLVAQRACDDLEGGDGCGSGEGSGGGRRRQRHKVRELGAGCWGLMLALCYTGICHKHPLHPRPHATHAQQTTNKTAAQEAGG